MGKRTPDQGRIIGRFLAEPENAEVREVLPIVPKERIAEAIQERYGLGVHETQYLSYEQLAAAVGACETLREGGLDPAKYDYGTWFLAQQASLEDRSPKQLLWRKEYEAFSAFAERTAAQVQKLG